MSVHVTPVTSSTIVVAVDVGKTSALFSVSDAARHRLIGPSELCVTGSGLTAAARGQRLWCRRPAGESRCGNRWPLPPTSARPSVAGRVGGVGAQSRSGRRAASGQGRRRVKTDVIDPEAITELVLAGYGRPVSDRDVVIGEVNAWQYIGGRRVATRTATKNQLLGRLDGRFPD